MSECVCLRAEHGERSSKHLSPEAGQEEGSP